MLMKRKEIEKAILALANEVNKFQSSQLLEKLPQDFATRQYISGVINDLVAKGVLSMAGSKRFTYYALPSKADALVDKETRTLQNIDLKEHLIYEELTSKSALIKKLNENANSILDFAFSEMLNNAIEHSGSDRIKIELYRDG